MKTEQYQCAMAGTDHWINVPASWAENLRGQGFAVRELIVRPSTEQIADKLLADALNVIDAGRARRRTEAEYLAENPERRGNKGLRDLMDQVSPGLARPIDGPSERCRHCRGNGERWGTTCTVCGGDGLAS